MTVTEAERVFGLPANASDKDVRSTYFKLVQVWHPDRFSARNDLAAFAHEGLVSINEAYEVLLSRSQSSDRRSSRRPTEHQSAQGTIFGFKPTPVMVWMGANGFSEYQIRAVLRAYKGGVADTTIKRARLHGISPDGTHGLATLSAEQGRTLLRFKR